MEKKKKVFAFSVETTVTGTPRPPRWPAASSQAAAVVGIVTTLVSIAVAVAVPLFTG
ncbi:hypothetical protein NY551_18150 [Curtobacterium flaccumfaciens pv. oortii]|uniref:hypothetical protein n=1 Tax=Curtobacterium flaccumfaciens TaxID=2035 RepID=UPI0026580C12|nr:hypothetical protein [Curtobacterium flaccumfaciens]MCS5524659.1 hypothetical protein [Curtobacterium flaccumfaciens pv. oortii]